MSQYIDEKNFDKNLRLGDIITGFSHIMPQFDDFFNKGNEFKLDITLQHFYVVLTPCCSIEEKIITLAPLKKIRYQFFENPYYKEDMTRINRPMSPQNAYPPSVWAKIPEEQKIEIGSKEEGYALFELFFYGPDLKLPKYELKYKTNPIVVADTYMIDFKEAFTIMSNKIQRGNTYPKILQLTILSRGELRNKLAKFYSRIPDEDLV